MTLGAGDSSFRVGLNYWPASTAMGWWPAFDRGEVETDFARIAESGFDSVRIFLTWEHFQPQADRVDQLMVERLVTTLELAQQAGLAVMPTLFTGHMSGVNWIPQWALGGADGDRRFRTLSEGRLAEVGLRNWYGDEGIAFAQAYLAGELARALAGHPALFAWDLGNENSNCVIPPTRDLGLSWLFRMSSAIRQADPNALVTLGLHMEDLEQNRRLGPAEAAQACDFLTMHGYPGYAPWALGATDEQLLPFLVHITRWLAGGAEIMFSEFGLPTYKEDDADGHRARAASSTSMVEEQAAAAYVERALAAIHTSGCTGAMLWCHADYARDIWQLPPLDAAVHERHFGLFRSDGSKKPALSSIEAFAKQHVARTMCNEDLSWIDIDRSEFYRTEETGLGRLYGLYRDARMSNSE